MIPSQMLKVNIDHSLFRSFSRIATRDYSSADENPHAFCDQIHSCTQHANLQACGRPFVSRTLPEPEHRAINLQLHAIYTYLQLRASCRAEPPILENF